MAKGARFVLWVGLVGMAALLSPPAAQAEDETYGPFPLVFHVATRDGADVASREALEALTRDVNERFRVASVSFRIAEVRGLPDGNATLENVPARRALRRHLVPHAINVFVVERIEDPVPSAATRRAAARVGREPSGAIAGAHIEIERSVPSTYILTTTRSSSLTLVHELGHFFSAPHHRDPENIMSYGPARSRFDEHQIRAFRARARHYVRRRILRVPPA
jgi:hypothetical protein